MKKVILLSVIGVLLAGCATSKMDVTRTLLDGTTIRYKVAINVVGQDLKGTDLTATLNPEGTTTVKAGAVNATTSEVSADVTQSFVELMKIMLPYIATAPPPPTP